MDQLTLTLHKTKDTKNKVVYGTKDGAVIQSGRPPVPNCPPSPPTVITASSPTGTERPWNWRPTTAATPRSRMRYATSSTASG